MKITILGGGLSSLSLAYFLQENKNISKIEIIEKEKRPGGLCRTFKQKGVKYDIGPHIFFSKDIEILTFINDLLKENNNKIRRSNQIIHKNRFIQYPFENDLSKLNNKDKKYCVDMFINNPYENYEPKNMLQFFLKTFGEGITNIYLRPYNEKIWKFDPSFMDTQMVERIPKPPKEDILKSAKGETVDGYLHQLYFNYPKSGGAESIIRALIKRLNKKVTIYCDQTIKQITKIDKGFSIVTSQKEFISEKIVSTIPINKLVKIYKSKNEGITKASKELKYNSIIISIVNVKNDIAKNNFAFMLANKNIIFHRLSKIDFLGDNYHKKKSTSYLIEITFRKGDQIDKMKNKELFEKIKSNLIKIKFIKSSRDINFLTFKKFEYAYVIYDLNHRKNVDLIKNYFTKENIFLNGRFGTFEYLNMDGVIKQSLNLSNIIKSEINN